MQKRRSKEKFNILKTQDQEEIETTNYELKNLI